MRIYLSIAPSDDHTIIHQTSTVTLDDHIHQTITATSEDHTIIHQTITTPLDGHIHQTITTPLDDHSIHQTTQSTTNAGNKCNSFKRWGRIESWRYLNLPT